MTAGTKCCLWTIGGTIALGGGSTGGHFLREWVDKKDPSTSSSQSASQSRQGAGIPGG
nr:hypothetical protein [Candidatus Mycoplasma haematolamae]